MSCSLFWVRHGAHDQLGWKLSGRTPGVRLGEPGLEQARAAGRRLARERLERVFTSPLERTRQTAEAIAAETGAPLEPTEAILEIDFGAWNDGMIRDLDPDPDFIRWNAGRDSAACTGGESMLEVQARVFRFMESVVASGVRSIACVSHADVIKAAVMVATGLSPRAHDRLEVSPGSVTCIAGSRWGYKLMFLNEMPHG